ncbi:MAG TPA: pantoate--beta-alanine ligase [Candidatus Rubrimentiphilum sp.]|nr:pantoate--beta-alanine ligase [Candidatus Rubrimentiphilum sp.]
MRVIEEPAQARAALQTLARPIGFVPTMGALHAGHLRLIETARQQCGACVVSLFVNPLQFGPNEDYERYPRDLEHDRQKLEASGVDVLFAPQSEVMYTQNFSTTVSAGEIGERYEGAIRPGHFDGVTTVVAKLLNIVQPDVLYLGQKDAQQAVILTKLVRELNFAAEVRIVETVREADGLALSSRNAYLSPSERAAAPSLHVALNVMLTELQNGAETDRARARGLAMLDPSAQLDYLDLVDAHTFQPLPALRAPAFLIGAAKFGRTRLIDNLWVRA